MMNIAGVLVHAKPDRMCEVEKALQVIPGVEVHAMNEDGRLVITVEENEPDIVGRKLLTINQLEDVFSAAMVFQYSDENEA